MIVYNLFFLIPFFFWLINKRDKKFEIFYFFFIFLFYILILGLRDNIGNDWHAYQDNFYQQKEFTNILFDKKSNYFFDFISNFNLYIGSFEAYNFITSLIFLIGIFIFSYYQQDKIFAITLCYPYLMLFVGMGYIRQSISISLFLIALTFVFKKKPFLGIFFILLSILTHKMIIISCLILFLTMDFKKHKSILKLMYFFLPIIFIVFYLSGYAEHMIKFYMTESNYFSSKGVLWRLILAIFPALLLFSKTNESYVFSKSEISFFKYSSYFVIVLIPLSFLFSTAVDRILIFTSLSYVYIYTFSNNRFYASKSLKIFLQPLILMLLMFYLNIWLFFSEYRFFWLPYENLIMKIF